MHPTWEEPPDLIAAKEAAAAASPSKPKTNAAEAAVAASNHAKHQTDKAAKQRSPLKPGGKKLTGQKSRPDWICLFPGTIEEEM